MKTCLQLRHCPKCFSGVSFAVTNKNGDGGGSYVGVSGDCRGAVGVTTLVLIMNIVQYQLVEGSIS